MPTAKKQPSGNWKVRIYDYTDDQKQKHYKSFTGCTKKQAELKAAEYQTQKSQIKKDDMIFSDAREKYISSKSNVVSPATIRGYNQQRTYFSALDPLTLHQLTDDVVQKWVNDFSEKHSSKTVRNAYGLLTATLRQFAPDITLHVTLPAREVVKYTLPTEKDVQAILKHFTDVGDKDMLRAIYLSAFGTLRRSEICALTAEDISGNTIHVSKAMVMDENKKWKIKQPKTFGSDRYVTLPAFVIAALPKDGKIITELTPDNITHRFRRALTKCGIKHFRFHDLRHYSATIMHTLNIPDQYIMQMGGWKSDAVLKSIYRNTLDDYSEQFEKVISGHFSEKFDPRYDPKP